MHFKLNFCLLLLLLGAVYIQGSMLRRRRPQRAYQRKDYVYHVDENDEARQRKEYVYHVDENDEASQPKDENDEISLPKDYFYLVDEAKN